MYGCTPYTCLDWGQYLINTSKLWGAYWYSIAIQAHFLFLKCQDCLQLYKRGEKSEKCFSRIMDLEACLHSGHYALCIMHFIILLISSSCLYVIKLYEKMAVNSAQKCKRCLRKSLILVNNQLDAKCFTSIYFYSLHVSGSHVRIIRRITVSMRHLPETCRE